MKKEITYGEAIKICESERLIKDHFTKTYPTENVKIFGRYGHELSETGIKRLIKWGQDNNDKVLLDHIINRIKVYNEIYDIKGFVPSSVYIRKGKFRNIYNS